MRFRLLENDCLLFPFFILFYFAYVSSIIPDFLDSLPLPYNPQSCNIEFFNTNTATSYYSTGKTGDIVKVSVSNDTARITFTNITLINDSSQTTTLSGTIVGRIY